MNEAFFQTLYPHQYKNNKVSQNIFSYPRQKGVLPSCSFNTEPYIWSLSPCVVMELKHQPVNQFGINIFLIGTHPGEVVLTCVVAHCEAARCVQFNW